MTAWWQLGRALFIVGAAGLAGGCAEQSAGTARIAADADAPLRKMSSTLSNARAFSVRGTTRMDEVLDSGQLVQFSRETRVLVRRPDRLFAEVRRGEQTWTVWHAGRELTVLDKNANTFASVQVPQANDEMLDELAMKHGMAMPLADFLFSDPHKVLTAGVLAGEVIGAARVEGAECAQLLFTQDNVDWQIWIETGGSHLPRKIVIDYKHQPGRPQFEAVLTEWNLQPAAGDDAFTPSLPADAKQVDMSRLLDAK